MRAMVFEEVGKPLELKEVPRPSPGKGQVLIKVHACGICRTDLHIIDGELPDPKLPLILGHQIVGHVEEVGPGVDSLGSGERVGVPWLGWTCGRCRYCLREQENLCDNARFTGYNLDGGFAEYAVAHARYCLPIAASFADLDAAPLLCGGLIGYRAYRMARDARRIGFFGFGSAAHILAQVARFQDREVYAFTRPGDEEAQKFARGLGAVWAGPSDEFPPQELDAAILFAPIGSLIPQALRCVCKGGSVICAGIHMSDIPSFPYQILWGERVVRSVANLTVEDGISFMELAPQIPVRTQVSTFGLEEANEALLALRQGAFTGSAVLVI